MTARRSHSPTAAAAVLALFTFGTAACVPLPEGTRDGGIPCSDDDACNPRGPACGLRYRCVTGVCSTTPRFVVCLDGGYPASDANDGVCLSYRDCNGGTTCGLLVDCVDNRCDITGTRIEIPCTDSGARTDR